MVGVKIRQAVAPIYHAVFDTILSGRRKAQLRDALMRQPVTSNYPFDIEAKLLRSIGIKPAMLDIGANTGVYSSALEDVVGSKNLYLFEPLPHLYRRLQRRFRRAHVYNFALSNVRGTQNIRVPYINGKRFDSRATLGLVSEPNQTGSEEIPVKFFTLDSIVEEIAFDSIGFMKIDVEGHEYAVLQGAMQTIDRFKPLLLIEIEARHHAFPITEMFIKLEGLGYKGYYIVPETFSLRETAHFDVQRDQKLEDLVARRLHRYLNNFFFVPQDQEREFVVKALGFLEAEKQLVAEPAGR